MRDVTGPPWTIYDKSDALRVKIKGVRPRIGASHVATVLGEDNAALIAAAPDMLAALVHVEAVLCMVEPRSNKAEYLETLAEVRTAIAKAECTAPSALNDRHRAIGDENV